MLNTTSQTSAVDALTGYFYHGFRAAYRMLRPSGRVKDTLQHVWESTGIYAKREGSKVPAYPKVLSVEQKKHLLRIRLSLPPGLCVEIIQKYVLILDAALEADCEVWQEKGVVIIEAHTLDLPRRFDYDSTLMKRLANYSLAVPIGLSRAGFEVLQLTSGYSHLLVGGLTDTGKSVFLRQALAAIHEAYIPTQVQLVLADLKLGNEFKLFRDSPYVLQSAKNERELGKVLAYLNAELDRRAKLLEHTPYTNLKQFNERVDTPLPYLMLVVDEFAEVPEMLKGASASEKKREQQQENANTVDRLLRLGRSHGIHCIICTQRPTIKVIPGEVKAQCAATVALRVRSGTDSRVLLDYDGAENIEPVPGRAIYQAKKDRKVQIAWLSEAHCRRIVKDAIERYPKPFVETEYEIEV